ncbi:hypothetical protein MUN74_00755 [Agromyces endophyticus]|uniref:hypothetical protein n=1 Tax=Agromyces sp. H17E-10 TaxID=2932244 RepID=UPI001FCFFA76|nr:hypothetical protein [Agromyces sp. H17E-10]UOQ89490.1 hypothetical protein MUN74_00755 [Agromyces sp. H17E-10]
MFYGMGGWHVLVILGVMLVFALVVAAIVVPIVLVARHSATTDDRSAALPRTVESRLRELDDLRNRGVISPAEHEAQRAAIIHEL